MEMKPQDKIIAVVVTYNRKDLLKENIAALLNQTRRDCLDILIIDNDSTDGTHEDLLPLIEKEEILYNNTGSNLGGAGGFNYGIRKAVEAGYKYVWIMDDDTIPSPTALEAFLKKDAELNGNYGFLSSKVLWKDQSICLMNVQKETKWKRIADFEKDQTIQYASFVSLFLRAETVKEFGLPYKEFFIWADDWEYTRRISKAKKSFFVPESVVTHFCGSNVGADIVDAPADRIDRFNYMYRNDVVLYRLDGLEGKIYLTIRNAMHRAKILLKSDHKSKKLQIIADGTKKGKHFFPEREFPEIKEV